MIRVRRLMDGKLHAFVAFKERPDVIVQIAVIAFKCPSGKMLSQQNQL